MKTDQEMNSPRKLKADLHIHTQEDPKDKVKYTAKQLINEAWRQKFDVLAITNHNTVLYDDYLRKYASDKGILLIPGIEVKVEGKHIILLNVNEWREKEINTLEELRCHKGEGSLIIAPHPYFPTLTSLGKKLDRYIHILDALEYTHFYFRGINFNKKVERKAKQYNLPLLGVSDAHLLSQFGSTYSVIDAEKTPQAVIRAIKENKVEIVTRPLKLNWGNIVLGFRHTMSPMLGSRDNSSGG